MLQEKLNNLIILYIKKDILYVLDIHNIVTELQVEILKGVL